MTNYADIYFTVLQSRAINPHLAVFLETVARWRPFTEPVGRARLHEVRNKIFRWFLAESDAPFLLTLDDCGVVTEKTLPLLESTADITFASLAMPKDGREAHPGGMNVSAVKYSRDAVVRLGQCWKPVPECGCECPPFYEVCKAAGFEPVKAGEMGHCVRAVLSPGGILALDSNIVPLGSVVDPAALNPADKNLCRPDGILPDAQGEDGRDADKNAPENGSDNLHGQ